MTVVIRHGVVKLTASLLLLLAAAQVGADTGYDNRLPDLGDYPQLRAEAGHIVAFEAEAYGVQIYRWNGTKWDFVAPEALLFRGQGVVAIHYAGPNWESASGSKVVGAVVDRATPDPDSIPWLLLKATSTEGPGIFNGVTFIQRLYTEGGLPPDEPGDFVGEEARVPYAADYVFYRKP